MPGYVRYVDDLFLFADRRGELRRWRAEIGAWLERERGLRLKHPEARVLSCSGHLDALGMRVTRAGLEPRRRAVLRLRAQVAREVRSDRAGRPVDPCAALRARVGGILFG